MACLGVTDSDWRFLAEAALEGFDINVAEKAYRHLRDFKHLDFIFEFQVISTENLKNGNRDNLL